MQKPLYPDLTACWEKGPLVKENFSIPQGKPLCSEEETAFLKTLYGKLRNPELRCTLVRELAQLENRALGELFFPCFRKETNEKVRKEFLHTFLVWNRKGIRIPALPETLLKEIFSQPDPGGKRLLAELAIEMQIPISLEAILPHIDLSRDHAITDLLAANCGKLRGDKRKEGEKLLQNPSPYARSLGIALLWDASPKPDQEPLFRKIIAGKELSGKLVLARLAASSGKDAAQILASLGEEKINSIQLTLADSMRIRKSREKETLLLRYLAPGNPAFLRIASARNLAEGNDQRALPLLLAAMGEENSILRKTARDCLIARNPGKAFRDRLAGECRKTPHFYREGAAFFAALPDGETAAGFFARLLSEKNHPETMILHALSGLEKIGNPIYAPLAAAYAGNSSAAVRKAAAKALGKMKNKSVTTSLKRLMLDKAPDVAEAAFTSGFLWQDALLFAPEIRKTLRSRGEDRAPARLGAVKCAQGLPAQEYKLLQKDLAQLLMEECIRVPAMPKCYDREEVRLSILLLLNSRKETASGLYRKASAKLKKELSDPEKGAGMDSMKEFLRQLDVFNRGEKVIPSPVPDSPPVFSFSRMK